MRAMISPATPLSIASGLMMASVRSAMSRSPSDDFGHGRSHVGRACDQRGPRRGQGLHLLGGRAPAARDDGPGVSHAPTGGARWPAIEATTRFPAFPPM